MPNCSMFYRVSDNALFSWASIVSESHKLDSMLEPGCAAMADEGLAATGSDITSAPLMLALGALLVGLLLLGRGRRRGSRLRQAPR